MIFNEEYDLIFYKYLSNFEEIFDEVINKILELKANKQQIEEEIKNFYADINTILEELRDAEISPEIPEAFPKEEAEEELKGFRFKIVVCGDSAVGKTSTVLRFTNKAFKRTYIPTIGVNICEKGIQIENKKVEFIIWDIAGRSRFQMMRKHFYQGADGQLLIFDLTRLNTFKNITNWHQDIKSYIGEDLCGLIIGNKSDLVDLRKVQKEEIIKLAKELSIDFIETSALSGENVDEAFNQLGKILIERGISKIKS